MADEADMSQARMEKEAELMAAARQRAIDSRSVSDECEECGDAISEARQKATGGTDMCFECANKAETKRKHYR